MKIFQVKIFLFLNQLFLCCGSLPTGEPLCTKFSYDEMLLEKMVRMEFDVKTMERNMLETEKRIEERQETMIETKNSNGEILKEIDKKIKQLEQREVTLNATINQKIAEIKKRTDPAIAFNAHKAADKSLANLQVIVFSEVILNDGDGYDKSNGYFTAPVNGIYHFTAHLCGRTGKNIHYVLQVGDNRVASGLFNPRTTGQCTSFSVTARMLSGEKAWTTIDEGGSTSADLLYDDSNDWNYFTGFLVHELD